jgi:single-strand DNA-binding protein
MDDTTRNEVLLVGRLAAPAEERELPSGDVLSSFRVVVDRPPARRPAPGTRPPTVDALECVVWTAALRKAAAGWGPGDVLEVQGSLRRRFWRAPTGASSRYEVEVVRAKRVARAA